jgi:hypothetical protein
MEPPAIVVFECESLIEERQERMSEAIDWEKIAAEVRGTCLSESAIIEKYDLDADEEEVIERLLDHETERCQDCEWWHEVCMLNDDQQCDSCADEEL